jgi:hypothetical protein
MLRPMAADYILELREKTAGGQTLSLLILSSLDRKPLSSVNGYLALAGGVLAATAGAWLTLEAAANALPHTAAVAGVVPIMAGVFVGAGLTCCSQHLL